MLSVGEVCVESIHFVQRILKDHLLLGMVSVKQWNCRDVGFVIEKIKGVLKSIEFTGDGSCVDEWLAGLGNLHDLTLFGVQGKIVGDIVDRADTLLQELHFLFFSEAGDIIDRLVRKGGMTKVRAGAIFWFVAMGDAIGCILLGNGKGIFAL